jgi:thymidylate kinase
MRKELLRQKQNLDYIQNHYQELKAKYRNRWIVISSRGVVMSADDPCQLLLQLKKMKQKNTFTYYMSDPEEFMIL